MNKEGTKYDYSCEVSDYLIDDSYHILLCDFCIHKGSCKRRAEKILEGEK